MAASSAFALDRRTALVGAGALALVMSSGKIRAAVPDHMKTLMRRVMGLRWSGYARLASEGFEGGYLTSSIVMEFRLVDDWTFAGDMHEEVIVDNRTYRGHSAIWGNCWVVDGRAGLSIDRMRNISGDRLPGDVGWSTSTGTFRFGNDTDRPGHFALQGVLRDDYSKTPIEVFLIDS